jgi:pyruvate,orthophosphate dikinase
LSRATGAEEAALRPVLEELAERGAIEAGDAGYSLTPGGTVWLDERLAEERADRAPELLEALYGEFEEHNARLKRIVTAWQLREVDGAVVPNDHSDAAYDERLRRSLVSLDERFRPLLERLAQLVPRWTVYGRRFDAAIDAIDHDDRFIASPLLDSYHTVWFELHEELILAAGRTRESDDA